MRIIAKAQRRILLLCLLIPAFPVIRAAEDPSERTVVTGLSDQNEDTRFNAAHTLAGLCIISQDSKAPLLKMMNEDSARNRCAALEAYAAMFPDSYEVLFKKLDNASTPNAKLDFALVIISMGMYGAIPRMERVWKDSKDDALKHGIARAMLQMSGNNKYGLARLKECVTDHDLVTVLEDIANPIDVVAPAIGGDPIWFGFPASHWVDRLTSEFPRDRLQAIKLMQQHARECPIYIPRLVAALPDSDRDVRDNIMNLLRTLLKVDSDATIFVTGLSSSQEDMRYFSAVNLLQLHTASSECEAPLLKMMDEKSDRNRRVALEAYVVISRDYEPLFTKLVKATSSENKLNYVDVILRMGKYQTLSGLTKVWKASDDEHFKRDVARAILSMSEREFSLDPLGRLDEVIKDADLAKQIEHVAGEKKDNHRRPEPSIDP